MKDKIFVASLVYEVKLSKSGKILFEEQLVLIEAKNKIEANQKAIEIANSHKGIDETLTEGYQIWSFFKLRYLVPVDFNENTPIITRTLDNDEWNNLPQEKSNLKEILNFIN
ncbi:MAG: DUF4288 domain-containing protein [Bacteroidia bacterium]